MSTAMRTELISIATDTYPLDGLYYEPEGGATAGGVLLMHGNCMNFYTGPARFLPPVLTRLGYACLAYNRRGHDVVATLNSRQAVGGAFQLTREALADNRYAAEWFSRRGFPEPVVIGHSNGGMLAVPHVIAHPNTRALVLMSAHAGGPNLIPMAAKTGLFGAERHDEIVAQARAMVAAGRGHELILMPGWWYVVTAQTFADYSDTIPDVLALAPQVRCPTLYIRGDKEPAHIYPAEEFAKRSSGPTDVAIVPDCDHFYTGRFDAVSELVGGWLKKLAPVVTV
jgi:pimeloyl-ACP methyl ester carboxylesterase